LVQDELTSHLIANQASVAEVSIWTLLVYLLSFNSSH